MASLPPPYKYPREITYQIRYGPMQIESPQDDPRAFHAGDYEGIDDLTGRYLLRPRSWLGLMNPLLAHLGDIFPGPRPGGGGGFTLSINRSSSPGGNTRTFILGRPGQTDFGPDRVMPMREYVTATVIIVN